VTPDQTILERTPPQAVDVEQAVLGAMLMSKEAIGTAIEILDEDSFYQQRHRNIFVAMIYLYDNHVAVDLITLADELAKRNQLQEVGGRSYLVTLTELVATAANIAHHCNIVLEKATARQLQDVAVGVVNDCYNETKDPKELLNEAQRKLFDIAERSVKQSPVRVSEFIIESLDSIITPKHITGLETGFRLLDIMTEGLQNSDLIIVGGRPGHGKTSFGLNVADYVATREKPTPALIFSLEMSRKQVGKRLLLARARLPRSECKTDESVAKFTGLLRIFEDCPIFVDDSPIQTPLQIKAKARRLKTAENIGLIIVDYLQLLTVPGFDSEYREISYASKSLKALAKELNIPVMVLSQFSRKTEERGGDRRPRDWDLRGSGTIEQDADVILFVYRPWLYKPLKIVPIGETERQTPSENYAELILSKQRSGPTGSIELFFDPESTRFVSVSKREEI